MASLEDEIKDLREKNKELVQKVQYWKVLAGQREKEKLNLMKEINELRLKLGRYRSTSDTQARTLDTALQEATEKALVHIVRASNEITKTMELTKSYMRQRQEEAASPWLCAISGTPADKADKPEKVHRVPPMMGGRSIQPVVALSRTVFSTSNTRATSDSPNQSRRNVTERAEPMHVLQARLQDAYIPLTRVDAELNSSMQMRDNANDDSSEELELDDSNERLNNSQISEAEDDYDTSRPLDTVAEDIEPEDGSLSPMPTLSPLRIGTPRLSPPRDPLEGPSWLLDKRRKPLEPDSTTVEPTAEDIDRSPSEKKRMNGVCSGVSVRVSSEFSPTVRRRKRAAPPSPTHASPKPPARRNSNSGRILKVLVAKMPLAESPKRPMFVIDAPSPNGATMSGVIVSESTEMDTERLASGEPAPAPTRDSRRCVDDSHTSADDIRTCADDSRTSTDDTRDSRRGTATSRDPSRDTGHESRDSRDCDSDTSTEGRSRRNRKAVEYKEKPLNRKMRR